MNIRRATEADAAELMRLRLVMIRSAHPAPDGPWIDEGVHWFADRLHHDATTFAAFAADGGTGLVSCAVAWVIPHLPRPGAGPGRGRIASVATDPEHRRRGYARACVAQAQEWLIGRDCSSIDLNASNDGLDLYLSMGFTVDEDPSMIWRRPS